jgi:hypothetical protein
MGGARARRLGTRAACVLLILFLWDSMVPAPAAQAAQHSILSVNVYKSRGFMFAEAWFEDVGPSSSSVAVWIDSYQATTGAFLASYGLRVGTSSCAPAGSRCSMLLKTSVQAQWGECYVARALSVQPGGEWVSSSDPPRELFCA